MKNKRNFGPLIIIVLSLLISVFFGFLLFSNYVNALEDFKDDGYILVTNKDGSNDAINEQHYFSSGSSYKKTYDGSIVFDDINDNKVTIDSKNFIHYSDNSLCALDDTVLLDADKLEDTQISYYSISSKSVLSKAGDSYVTENAGTGSLDFKNFVWKISDQRYMVVSDQITLVVSDTSQQVFWSYIELQYIDEGVAYLVNQDGTYSTISSDAYLQLGNGVRIYIGSKNVSNDEEILVNLTQMVVDSDDNIEVIPDEDYNIESDEQPQIVVNATDGEDGEEGESGDEGKAGDPGESGNGGDGGDPGTEGNPGKSGNKGNQGAAGDPGTQGNPGSTGKMAENAGLTYNEEQLPKFSLKDGKLDVTAYSVDGTILYDSNNCVMIPDDSGYAASFMIINNADNTIVWKRNIKQSDLNTAETGNPISKDGIVSILKQDTIYTFAINSTFKISSDDDNYVTQQVFQQEFTTETYDISLKFDYATTDSLTYSLSVGEGALGVIDSIKIELYNEQRDLAEAYVYPDDYSLDSISNASTLSCDSAGYIVLDNLTEEAHEQFEISGDKIKRNTIYYARVVVMSTAEDVGITIPSSSFDYVLGQTLKKTPTVDRPTVVLSDRLNSFTVTPGEVIDYDNGVTGYRFDFYEITTDSNKQEVYTMVYSYDADDTDAFSVPLASSDDTNSESILYRGRTYCVKQIALFNNNLNEVEVSSVYSDRFSSESTVNWPAAIISLKVYKSGTKKGLSSPSIIDGELSISDEDHVITEASTITIVYESTEPVDQYIETASGIYEKKTQTIKGSYTVSNTQALNGSAYANGSYLVPFAFNALKQDTTYTISAYAGEIIWDGVTSSSDPGTLLASVTTTTATYTELYVSGYNATVSDTGSGSSFDVDIVFSLDPDAYADEAANKIKFSTYCQKKYGITDTVDMSAKAMTAISFDVYEAKHVYEGSTDKIVPNTEKKLNDASCIVTSSDKANRKSHSFATLYQFDSDFYRYEYEEGGETLIKGAYLGAETTFDLTNTPENDITTFTVSISNQSFDTSILNSNIATYLANYKETYETDTAPIFIKCNEAYDYTYGLGTSEYRLYDKCNVISIGDSDKYTKATYSNYTANIYDQWVESDTNKLKPEWHENPPYFTLKPLTTISASTDTSVSAIEVLNSIKGTKDKGASNIACLSNLVSSDVTANDLKNASDDSGLWDTDVTSSQTIVGYEIQGDSEWLASFASAVRYIVYENVYDASGKLTDRIEITKSYNNVALTGATIDDNQSDGWIYFDRKYATANGLPKWYFFFDVASTKSVDSDDKTDDMISRGEPFTVKMEIKLRDFENDVWPANSNYIIQESFVAPKQSPIIMTLQYDGDTVSTTHNDIFYAVIKDTDKTFDYYVSTDDNGSKITNYDKIVLYDGNDEDRENPIIATRNVETDNSTTYTPPTGFEVISINLTDTNSIGNLYAYYDVGEKNTIVINDSGEYFIKNKSYDYKHTLANELNITKGSSISIESFTCPNSTDTTSNNGFSFITTIKSDTITDLSSINKIVITFTNKDDTEKTYKVTTKCSTNPYDSDMINETDENENEITYYLTKIPTYVPFDDLSSITNKDGPTDFEVTCELFSMTGKYGAKYLTSGGYYLLEKYDSSDSSVSYSDVYLSGAKIEYNYSSTSADGTNVKVWSQGYQEDDAPLHTLKFSSNGFLYIPKEIAYQKETIEELTLNYIFPDGKLTCSNRGRNFLSIRTKIDSFGTICIDNDHGLEVYYRAHEGNDASDTVIDDDGNIKTTTTWKKAYTINPSSLDPMSSTNIVSGLDYNTEYDFVLVGYFKKKDSNQVTYYEAKIIDSLERAKTLTSLTIDDSTSRMYVDSTNTSRDSKYMIVDIGMKNINRADIKTGIKNVNIKIYRGSDYENAYDADTQTGIVFEDTILGTDFYSKVKDTNNVGSDTVPGDYVYTYYYPASNDVFDFSPNSNGSHIMDKNTEYKAIITLTYNVTKGDTANETQVYEKIKCTPNCWNNVNPSGNPSPTYDDSNSYFRILPSNGVNTDEDDNINYYVKYTISAWDSRRILTSDSLAEDEHDKVAYCAVLYKINDDGTETIVDIEDNDEKSIDVVVKKETVIDNTDPDNPVQTTVETKNKVMYIKSSASGSSVAATTFYCNNLDRDTTYRLKIYANTDYMNIDSIVTPVVADCDFTESSDIYKSYNYCTYSQTIDTPSSTGIEIYGSDLQPNVSRVAIYGNGLNLVKKITYTLYDTTDQITYPEVTLINSSSVTSEDNINNIFVLNSMWGQSVGSNNTYYLSSSNLNNSNHNYYIIIGLYTNASDTTPAMTHEGTFTTQDEQPTVKNTTSGVLPKLTNAINEFVESNTKQ